MTKKWNKKLLLISSAAAILPVAALASIASCGSTNNGKEEGEELTLFNENKFKVEQKLKLSNSSRANLNDLDGKEVYVYDGKFNIDAQQALQKIQDNLSVKALNNDFRKVLTDFYEAYEFEEQSSNVKIEIELIRVLNKNKDGSFKLEVHYEKESDDTRDKDEDEELERKEIDWTPKLKLISKNDIEEIKRIIRDYSNNDNQNGIDLSDVKELFLGENDDDRDEDDFGIFDRIAKLNKEYDNLAYLVAYEISINDIFGQLGITVKRNNGSDVDKNTKFTVPSLSINGGTMTFIPNKKPDLDYTLKAGLTQTTIDTIFNGSTNDTTSNLLITSIKEGESGDKLEIIKILNQLLATEYKAGDLTGAKDISELTLIKQKNESNVFEYKVLVHFGTTRQAPDMFYVYPSARV